MNLVERSLLKERLIRAVKNGDSRKVKELLSLGCPASFRDSSGMTPLMYAARHGRDAVAGELLFGGADLSTLDDEECSALWLALRRTNDSLIQRLYRAHVSQQVPIPTWDGRTPLQYAVESQCAGLTYNLIAAGAPVNGIEELITGDHYRVDDTDYLTCTALHVACMTDAVGLVDLLLDWGADLEARNSAGRTPILEAALNDNLEIAKLLEKQGANTNLCDERSGLTYAQIMANQRAIRESARTRRGR